MNTLLLDDTEWDLLVDAQGNIALASEPYSFAQDVASALRLFKGEAYYDTTKGVPYFAQILGANPPLALLKQLFVDAALSVPGIVSATCTIQSADNRRIDGQVQFIDANGKTGNVRL